eukprot:TRINITY_DN7846_c0_g1_i1.p1 TRINITY_DN7846_c0_g1~~TRINITY_DN7846_c0_g1_i1.p1  ORF type:complete len:289 (-),score=53.14 TRINITY_DN7846_c0_g1_i1:141-1007(-)
MEELVPQTKMRLKIHKQWWSSHWTLYRDPRPNANPSLFIEADKVDNEKSLVDITTRFPLTPMFKVYDVDKLKSFTLHFPLFYPKIPKFNGLEVLALVKDSAKDFDKTYLGQLWVSTLREQTRSMAVTQDAAVPSPSRLSALSPSPNNSLRKSTGTFQHATPSPRASRGGSSSRPRPSTLPLPLTETRADFEAEEIAASGDAMTSSFLHEDPGKGDTESNAKLLRAVLTQLEINAELTRKTHARQEELLRQSWEHAEERQRKFQEVVSRGFEQNELLLRRMLDALQTPQ